MKTTSEVIAEMNAQIPAVDRKIREIQEQRKKRDVKVWK